MHHRDRAAPVALPRQPPVAQAELGHALTDAVGLAEIDGRLDRLFAALRLLAGKAPDIAHGLGLGRDIGGAAILGHDEGALLAHGRHEDRRDRQLVFAGEIHVALVMRGHAEDRAGAVLHQDEIGDVDRQLPGGVERVTRREAGVEAELLGLFQRLLGGAAAPRLGAEFRHIRALGLEPPCKRVIRRQRDEGRAHQRVGPGGVDLDAVMALGAVGEAKGELQPARPPDPVFLHGADLGGPVVEAVERIEQLLGEIRDAEEPLRELAPLDLRARTPAAPVLDLLVGEHRHVHRIPVDHGVLAVDEPGLEEVEKQRLLLAVILRVAGGEFARPVDRQAHRPELLAHGLDIGVGPVLGMAAAGHRGVLGGHAEGVPAHRVQHVVPGRQLVARHDVAHRVVADMAHVDAPRGVGEHLQHVVFRAALVPAGAKDAGLAPGLLPARLDLGG